MAALPSWCPAATRAARHAPVPAHPPSRELYTLNWDEPVFRPLPHHHDRHRYRLTHAGTRGQLL